MTGLPISATPSIKGNVTVVTGAPGNALAIGTGRVRPLVIAVRMASAEGHAARGCHPEAA